MNPIEVKRIDNDCYTVIMDGDPLGNKYNCGYFSAHDIQCMGDACQIAMMDAELSTVKMSREDDGVL